MNFAMPSMRRFIVLGIALILSALALLDGLLAYGAAEKALDETRDRALVRIAAGYLRALRAQDADTSRIPASVFREETGDDDTPELRFRVSDSHGVLMGGDPQLRFPADKAVRDRLVQAALYDDGAPGDRWRVAAVKDFILTRAQAEPVVVQVAESHAARIASAHMLGVAIAGRQALRLGVALALVYAVVMLGLRPLEALRAELARRSEHDFTPVPEQRPRELVPLVGSLNALLLAQQSAVDEQRKFLADASHQLRTPIAVLRTQVQGLLLGQTDAADTLPKMLRTIDRATALTNQLLAMAKVEQLVRRGDWTEVQLDQVARDVALEFAPLIARKRLDFSLQAAPMQLRTDSWMLGELVKNLLSNAIHHSKKGGALGIVVRQFKHETEMIVWDHGGGVDESMLGRLFEPFNASKSGTGIGLGLSICRQIADSMNATVDIFNRIEAGEVVGVDAVVRWPAAQVQPLLEPRDA